MFCKMLIIRGNLLLLYEGMQLLLEVCGAVEGRSREQCVQILKVCHLHLLKQW